MIFQWGHFLVHPLGVAPKAPSDLFKLLGGLCCRLCLELFFLWQEACKLGAAFVKLQGEHEALKKKHVEDNGKVMFPVDNEEIKFFRPVTFLGLNLQRLRRKRLKRR